MGLNLQNLKDYGYSALGCMKETCASYRDTIIAQKNALVEACSYAQPEVESIKVGRQIYVFAEENTSKFEGSILKPELKEITQQLKAMPAKEEAFKNIAKVTCVALAILSYSRALWFNQPLTAIVAPLVCFGLNQLAQGVVEGYISGEKRQLITDAQNLAIKEV